MNPFLRDRDFTLHVGDVREILPPLEAGSVDCVVTSPPYWGLRDYNAASQIGLEATPELYVATIVEVFRQVRRVLAAHGTLWLNLGDSYASVHGSGLQGENGQMASRTIAQVRDSKAAAGMGAPRRLPGAAGLKPKDLVGIPWRVAFALQADGWYLRSDIVWSKPNPMPESVTDRPTKSHEYVFLLTKGPRYFFDQEAVRESAEYGFSTATGNTFGRARQGDHRDHRNTQIGTVTPGSGGSRNVRSVWEIATQPYPEAHFATFPEALSERCIKAGCPEGGTVLDPFMGSGTVALVARRLGRRSIGIELNQVYAELCARRLQQLSLLAEASA